MKMKRIEFIKDKYKITIESDFVKLLSCDPTKEKKYFEWVCKLYSKEKLNIKEESSSTISSILEKYHSIKNRITPEYKDINKFKSLTELSAFLIEFILNDKKSEENFLLNGAQKIFEDNKLLIVKPFTFEASTKYGKSTQWCTTQKPTFYSYLSSGNLYIFIDKIAKDGMANKKFQLYLRKTGGSEFRKADENTVNEDSFFKKYPQAINPMCNEEYFLKSFAGLAIQMIENPNIELQREAIKLNYNYIKYIKTPSEEIQLLAVSKNVLAFQFIKKPCQNAQIKICEKNGKYIKKIYEKGIKPNSIVQLVAIKKTPSAIQYIENPTLKFQMIAVNKNKKALLGIKNPAEEVQIIAVKTYPILLKSIKNPSKEVQLEALKNGSGNLIKFIDNPTDEMKFIVLKKDPVIFKHLTGITKEMVFKTAKKKERILYYANFTFTQKQQLEIIKKNYKAIVYFKNPCEESQLLAIKKDFNYYKKIKNPTAEVKKLYEKKKKEESIKKRKEKQKLKKWIAKQQKNDTRYDSFGRITNDSWGEYINYDSYKWTTGDY